MKIFKYSLYTLLIAFSTLVTAQSDDELLQTTIKVPKLLTNIEMMYVEEVDKAELEANLVKGMNNGISPFSAYQKSDVIKRTLPDFQNLGTQSIGIKFKFSKDSIKVVEVIPGGGADAAGLKAGDVIMSIDGDSLKSAYYYSDILEKLVGQLDSKVKLDIYREGKSELYEVLRRPIKDHDLALMGLSHISGSINSYEHALPYFDAIYADSITNGIITEYGIRYMLDQLDPHSSYISLEDLHDMEAPLKGSFSGVGVRFQIFKDTIVVAEAIPGGPSSKVGIMAGDKFVYIDDEEVAGVGIKNNGVRERLLGEKGTKVNVKMARKGESELLDFTIIRDKIPIHSVDAAYMAAPEIGYIKINNFSANTVMEFREAVNDLKREGMKDLVIDLQNNGGGYLMTAVNLVDEMISGKKNVVYTLGRSHPKKSYDTRYTGLMEDGRVAILVNESSASASEIVSGAVQDWDRGLIIGRRTFSKGLVQKPIKMTDGTTVRITTSRYYTPSGRCIQKSYADGSQEYRKEKYARYQSGELFHKDSIHLNKDQQVSTLVKGRPVYGGEGIIPDIFVPLDTTGTGDYFSKLVRKGIFNRFTLNYVNDNRKSLQDKYPTFKKFKEDFKTDKVVKALLKYAESEDLEFIKEDFEEGEKAINIRLKAHIAQNLFEQEKFYEIINDLNDELQVAIEALQSGKEFKAIE